MDSELRSEIDSMITQRIVMYHRGLVSKGQIPDIPNQGPPANPPASGCSQSEHMPPDGCQGKTTVAAESASPSDGASGDLEA